MNAQMFLQIISEKYCYYPLSDDIYTYKLTKYQKLFMINSEKNKFDKYFRL